MYYVKYRDKDGWATSGPYVDPDGADRAYTEHADLYRYVTLVHTETVTNEVVLRDSTA